MKSTKTKTGVLVTAGPALLALAAVVCGLLAAWKPTLALATVLAVLLVAAVIAAPHIGTFVVIFVMYSNIAVVAVRFHGVPEIVAIAIPLVLGIPFAGYLLRRQKVIVNPVLPLILLFLAVQILGMSFSKDPALSASAVGELLVQGVVLYFLITNVVRTPETLRLATWALLLAGFITGAVPLYQHVTKTFDNNYGGLAQSSEGGFRTGEVTSKGKVHQRRSSGTIGEQNRYSQNMLMLVPLGLFLFWDEKSKRLRRLALICTCFSAIGCVLAFSRGTAVAFVLVLLIMMCMRMLKGRQLMIIALGAALLLAMMPQYLTRVTTILKIQGLFASDVSWDLKPDGAIKGRATEMLAAALVFVDHPVIGVGPGMARYYTQEYGNPLGIRTLKSTRETHSLYLGVAAENGALGLISFLAVLFVTLNGLFLARKRWLEKRPELANMATAYMLAIISYMATGLFLHMSYIRFFYLMLALAGAVTYVAKTTEGAGPMAPAVAGPLREEHPRDRAR